MATKIIKPFCESQERSKEYAQFFDRKKIMVTKAGETYNQYDRIQAAREDTEIYPTLEKYGGLGPMEKKNPQMIYADVSEALDLLGMYQQENRLKEIFENLPTKERNYFKNDFYRFREEGLDFYKKKAEAEIAKAQAWREQQQAEAAKPQKVEIVNKEDK